MAGSWGDETTHGWYDRGGVLAPGLAEVRNDSGVAEMVRRSRDYIRKRYGDPGDDQGSQH